MPSQPQTSLQRDHRSEAPSSHRRAPQPGAELLAEPMRTRWSPSVFDDSHRLTGDQIELLLTAAQWAPSAGNGQPCVLIVCERGTEVHDRLVATLSRGNAGWVPRASAVLVTVAPTASASTGAGPTRAGEDGRAPNPYVGYDVGQAAAHLTLQAHAMGLHAHQFAGFDAAAFAEAVGVPPTHEVLTGIAVGVRGDAAAVDERTAERDLRPRTRNDLATFAYAGGWGQAWQR